MLGMVDLGEIRIDCWRRRWAVPLAEFDDMLPVVVVAGDYSETGLAVDSIHDGISDCVSQVVDAAFQRSWPASPSSK